MSDDRSGEPQPSHSRVFVRSLFEESSVLLVQLGIVALSGVVGYLLGGALGMWLGLLVGFVLAGVAWVVFLGWAFKKGRAERRARAQAPRGR